MVNRVKQRTGGTEPTELTLTTRKPGRPINHAVGATSLSVTLTLLRQARLALLAAAGEARTASVKNQCTDVVNGLETRLGPRVNPDWQPDVKDSVERGRPAKYYRVVNPDGTEAVVRGLAAAAKRAGISKGALAVALSRGGGRYSRAVGESALTVEKWHETC